MKNITVSVPDELYHAARVKAAQQRTTISRIVRDQLATYATQPETATRTSRLLETIESFRRERANGPHLDPAENLTREELYEQAIRGHKRSDL